MPTLSVEAVHDTFYHIYKHEKQVDAVNTILEKLDFHPLSITLLATIAHRNKWNTNRLTTEWENRRTGILKTGHNRSIAATIELPLTSPTFQGLGSDARELLGVIAFFPQGVDEANLDWFFPAIPNRAEIFDGFCALSLTYRSDGFVRMLVPLSDYLSPKDPLSSPLLRTVKDCYSHRLSGSLDKSEPNPKESQWITPEDVNVDHLLDVFASIDGDSETTWNTRANFMSHLNWHEPRHLVLGSKIERLPDDHPSKPICLYRLSQWLASLGNYSEQKRAVTYVLKLCRELEDPSGIA